MVTPARKLAQWRAVIVVVLSVVVINKEPLETTASSIRLLSGHFKHTLSELTVKRQMES